jgi:hypothetical protein
MFVIPTPIRTVALLAHGNLGQGRVLFLYFSQFENAFFGNSFFYPRLFRNLYDFKA